MSQIATVEKMPAAEAEDRAAALTPMAMLTHAVERGASIEVMEKLLALQERWEASQARKAFDEAMARARAELPVIKKNRTVSHETKNGGSKTYQHEDLAEIARTVDPILAAHGLSYRFQTHSPPNEPVTVTCIVSHRLGHSEANSLSAGRDDSGQKNSIQALGSTITYLQRYTLKAALGLSASKDDDARAAAAPDEQFISAERAELLRKEAKELGIEEAKVCAYLTDGRAESFDDLAESLFAEAMAVFGKKREAMQKAAGGAK